MTRSNRRYPALSLALACALATPACAFLLDFDDLQDGEETDGGAGTGGTGGVATGGSGGSGGVVDACGGCDDGDPCTDDVCDTDNGPATCRFKPAALQQADFSIDEDFERLDRVTLASAGGQFFLSAYGVLNGKEDVGLYRFDRDGDASTLKLSVRLSELADAGSLVPASAAGLLTVVNGFDTELHAFVALRTGNQLGQVWDIVFDENLNVLSNRGGSLTAGANYAADTPTAHPVPWKSERSGAVYAAWGGPLGVHIAQLGEAQLPDANPPTFTAVGVRHLSPIVTASRTGVAYVGNLGVAARFMDDPPADITNPAPTLATPLPECSQSSAPATGITTAGLTATGLYIGAMTREDSSGPVTETVTLSCGEEQSGRTVCEIDETCDDPGRLNPGLRNPAYQAFKRSSDPSNRIHLASASPRIDSNPGLVLQLSRFDIGGDSSTGAQLGSLVLPASASGGPDYPVIALSDDDRMAVAWVEHEAGAGKLRIERLNICYPSTPQ